MKRMLIAGANGFIARHLTDYFSRNGWEVSGLARRRDGLHATCRYVEWDGKNLGDWVQEMETCDVLINMVGRSINCRHTEENKAQILNSRVDSTTLLGQAVGAAQNPPGLWINGSAAGIYEETIDRALGEDGAHGDGFIADVVKAWEDAFFGADVQESVRRVALRTTMVLADEPGNPLQILSKLAKFGLGGRAGSGKQMVSWIHIEDVVRSVEFIINSHQVSGPVNLAAPEAVSNAEMMRRFREYVGMPIGILAPAFGVRLGAYVMGTAPELVLNSSYVKPEVLEREGFEFGFPGLRPERF